jgi:hypothetical protein
MYIEDEQTREKEKKGTGEGKESGYGTYTKQEKARE